jgi:small-conductance mechanosensitive channel
MAGCLTVPTPPTVPVALPKFWHDHSRVLIEIPIRIAAIIVVAIVIRALLFRVIKRITRPAAGKLPGFLVPLRERVSSSGLLETAGLRSERRAQRAATLASVLRSCVSIVIFSIAFLLVLSEVQIDLAPFIAGTSIVGIAVAFGAQNIIKDYLSGLLMLFEDQYGVGDVIDFEKATGTVEAVGLRTTTLRDQRGTVWYVRNGEVVRVGNQSQGFARVVLDVPVDARADIEAAVQMMASVAAGLHDDPAWTESFLDVPQVEGIESMTLDETMIRVVAQVRPSDHGSVSRELRRRIRAGLEELRPSSDPDVQLAAAERLARRERRERDERRNPPPAADPGRPGSL